MHDPTGEFHVRVTQEPPSFKFSTRNCLGGCYLFINIDRIMELKYITHDNRFIALPPESAESGHLTDFIILTEGTVMEE